MSTTRKRTKRKAPPRPRKSKLFAAGALPPRDERVPAKLWELPVRIARANAAGPRYNQKELADKSGLSQSVLSKLNSWSNLFGLRLDTLYKLASALGTSVAYLLGEGGTATGKPRRRRAP